MFGPEILAFVVEPFGLLVEDYGEWHAIKPRDDSAVVFGSAPVYRNRVTLGRAANLLDTLIKKIGKHFAAIVGRPAN